MQHKPFPSGKVKPGAAAELKKASPAMKFGCRVCATVLTSGQLRHDENNYEEKH
ncbi:hypothetical protein [Duffyella gerundensis]|jgi:hypothetical protein|uniref:hypothetical protein n=1 Tax=Duffyella TaxID=3026546 RepID=UPI0016543413|nr:hypothetical protein [Duffyella gerundensis]